MSQLFAGAVVAVSSAIAGHAAAPIAPAEAFWTPFDPSDEISDLAVWHGAPAPSAAPSTSTVSLEHWLFAAGAKTDRLLRYDATIGQHTLSIGRPGDGLGELRRPVSLALASDFLVIAEQTSRRIQVFGLPTFSLLGAFGAETLKRPLAVAARITSAGLEVVALDGDAASAGPALWRFELSVANNSVTPGPPLRLRDAPAGTSDLAVDPQDGRLALLSPRELRVVSANGEPLAPAVAAFGDTTARAVALLDCADGSGAWVVAAASNAADPARPAVLSLFDRSNLAVRGSFAAKSAVGATGLAATSRVPGQAAGTIFVGHLGQGAVAIHLAEIAAATGVRACPVATVPAPAAQPGS